MSHASYIRDHSQLLEPIPTGLEPRLFAIPELRGVIFDIYGTLIISAAGDISLAGADDRDEAMRRAVVDGTGIPVPETVTHLTEAYRTLIGEAQDRRRAEGIEFPEVEIREIWRDLLTKWHHPGASDTDACERIAVAYEVAVNPVWPMPGLAETLASLKAGESFLGIISNAQFYTPHLFPAFLGDRDLAALGFDDWLQVYSYQQREGKPSRRLYEVLAERLNERDLTPGEFLYVGNDRRNDIWPAQAVGFRTALFAGDRRSLRLREEDHRVTDVTADLVVTDLRQLLEVVP
ncbi:MAG: HAD family hydrolase [Verrucomicrobiae bacterium]|nr:HAD family hydrolase [Verrucomicrobiae bacterium]